MMTSALHPPLQSRGGNVPKVLGIVRVSKEDKDKPADNLKQGVHDELSLEDQDALLRNWLGSEPADSDLKKEMCGSK